MDNVKTTHPILTIGHSNHPVELVLDLLHLHQIAAVIDVRTTSCSRYVPRFNRNNITRTLADNGINYVFAGHQPHHRAHDVRHICADRPDPQSHPDLLAELMRRHCVDDPDLAVDLQSSRAAYRRRT